MTAHRFHDPISRRDCTVHVGTLAHEFGVEHPGCIYRATVCPEIDCFYCPECGANGRISGAWFMDLLDTEAER